MCAETTRSKLELLLVELGRRVCGPGQIYLTGGATALLHGWRQSTMDVDFKADPELAGLFEALAVLKDELDINLELASPDQFLPELSGWRERSPFIAHHGHLDYHHYDLYSQALAKIERGHARDLADGHTLRQRQLIDPDQLWRLYQAIEPALIRFPAVEPATLRAAVQEFCERPKGKDAPDAPDR